MGPSGVVRHTPGQQLIAGFGIALMSRFKDARDVTHDSEWMAGLFHIAATLKSSNRMGIPPRCALEAQPAMKLLEEEHVPVAPDQSPGFWQ